MRYYIFDLDGTILNDQHRVAKGTKEFLADIKKAGHKIGILTGRHYDSLATLFTKEELKEFDYLGTYNGARVDFNNKTVHHTIDRKCIKNFQGDSWSISCNLGKAIYIDKPEQGQNIIERLRPDQILSLEDLKQDPYTIRFEFDSKKECEKQFNILLENKTDQDYEIVMSTGVYILVAKKGISKASALEVLKGEEIIFFGDSHNDLPVMELPWVTTVAPANAYDVVKDKADITLKTSNNETLRIDI